MNEARPLARLRLRFQQWARRFGVASADIEDLVQEALEIVWAKRAQVDPARALESWEFTILLNQARKYHRGRRLRRELLTPFDDREDARDACQNPEDSTLFRARLAVLQALIAQIDEARRDAFVEHHLLDLSIAEIASRHAIPEETVRTRLKRAWEEIDAARSRWQAEQRRRGGDILPAFLLPMGWRRDVTRVRRWP